MRKPVIGIAPDFNPGAGKGGSESEAYLEGWAPGPEIERSGGAEAAAREVAAELEAGFQDLVTRRFLGPPG